MKMAVVDCEVLALDSGVVACSITQEEVPVMFMTIRVNGQSPITLAVRNPNRLRDDLPSVFEQSTVLQGGRFISEHPELDDEFDE